MPLACQWINDDVLIICMQNNFPFPASGEDKKWVLLNVLQKDIWTIESKEAITLSMLLSSVLRFWLVKLIKINPNWQQRQWFSAL